MAESMNDPIERLYERALEALVDEDGATARGLLKQLEAAAPDDLRTYEVAGDCAALDEAYDTAVTLYAKLIAPDSPAEMRGRGHQSLAMLHIHKNDRPHAIEHFMAAAEAFLEDENPGEVFHCRVSAAECYGEAGNLKQAIIEFRSAIEFAHENELEGESDEILLDALRQLAECHRLLGELDEATDCYETLIEAAEAQGVQDMVAAAYDGIGVVHMIQGRFEDARAYLMKSLEIHEEIGHAEGLSLSRGNLARLHIQLEAWDIAEKYVLEAKQIDEDEDNIEGVRFAELLIAEIAIGRGQYADAEKQLKTLVRWYAEHGIYDDLLCTQSQLGYALRLQGRHDEALELQTEVLAKAREMGDIDGIASTLDELAELCLAQGDRERALALWQEALGYYEQLKSENNVAAIRERIAEV